MQGKGLLAARDSRTDLTPALARLAPAGCESLQSFSAVASVSLRERQKSRQTRPVADPWEVAGRGGVKWRSYHSLGRELQAEAGRSKVCGRIPLPLASPGERWAWMEDRRETQPFSSTLGEYSLHAGNFHAACGVGGKRWVARLCRGQHHSPASPAGSAAAAFCLLGLSFPCLDLTKQWQ